MYYLFTEEVRGRFSQGGRKDRKDEERFRRYWSEIPASACEGGTDF